ncbi:hypothetical protein BaRGS_00015490, partial [Batillaria attramentaria]
IPVSSQTGKREDDRPRPPGKAVYARVTCCDENFSHHQRAMSGKEPETCQGNPHSSRVIRQKSHTND